MGSEGREGGRVGRGEESGEEVLKRRKPTFSRTPAACVSL